jgi:hypothetical protein
MLFVIFCVVLIGGGLVLCLAVGVAEASLINGVVEGRVDAYRQQAQDWEPPKRKKKHHRSAF